MISAKIALYTIITKHYRTPTHCSRYMYGTFGQRIGSTGLERAQAVCWKPLIFKLHEHNIHVCMHLEWYGGIYMYKYAIGNRHDLRFVSISSGSLSITINSYLYFTQVHESINTVLRVYLFEFLTVKINPYIKITM